MTRRRDLRPELGIDFFSFPSNGFHSRHPVHVTVNQVSCLATSFVDYRDIYFAEGDYVVYRETEKERTSVCVRVEYVDKSVATNFYTVHERDRAYPVYI